MSETLCGSQPEQQLVFFEVDRLEVTVDIDGGQDVTDTGLPAIRKLDRELGVLGEAAVRLPDPRSQLTRHFSTERPAGADSLPTSRRLFRLQRRPDVPPRSPPAGLRRSRLRNRHASARQRLHTRPLPLSLHPKATVAPHRRADHRTGDPGRQVRAAAGDVLCKLTVAAKHVGRLLDRSSKVLHGPG